MTINAHLNMPTQGYEMPNTAHIHLDFLANFPLNQKANLLLQDTYANPNTFDSAYIASLNADSKALALLFGKSHAYSFDYSCGEFLSLFCTLFSHNYHIALSPSLSQQSFYAKKQFQALFPKALHNINLNQEGIIESALNSVTTKHELIAFFLPLINQDLLSINPMINIINEILSLYPHALIFCDISLFLSTLTQEKLNFLCSYPKEVLFICNGEHIGLMRKNGFILCNETQIAPLQAYNSTQLLRPSLFKAALRALEDILTSPKEEDSKNLFFDTLRSHLNENIGLFSPLTLSAENALSLRFKHIKARMLIQSLQIEGIYAINGQDCLFGNAKPSFVLHSMGYEEAQCRELLSVSYRGLNNIESLATRIAHTYLQLLQFSQ